MSYEDEAGDEWGEADVPQENQAMDDKVQIENMFYEAEGLISIDFPSCDG